MKNALGLWNGQCSWRTNTWDSIKLNMFWIAKKKFSGMKRHLWNGRTYLQCIRVDQCMQVCGIKPYVIFVYCKIPIAKYNSIIKWKILLRLMGYDFWYY